MSEDNLDIREAKEDDREDVLEFASETWDGWDYIPRVWGDWMTGDGTVLLAEKDGEAVGIVRYLEPTHIDSEDEAWLEGLRVDPDHRREGVATALVEEAVEMVESEGASCIRTLVIGDNEESISLFDELGFDSVMEFRRGYGFGFPYDSESESAHFDESIEFIETTDTYEKVNGLYLNSDWIARQIPESTEFFDEEEEIVAMRDSNGSIVSVAVIAGESINYSTEEDRLELVFGFVWSETDNAADFALSIRSEARERGAKDAVVILPDENEYINSFDQGGFDIEDEKDRVFELEI